MELLKKPEVKLFSLGFLTLLLELILIRYLAGTIWNLGYFPNLVLIAVFIGMGAGFVFHHHFDETKSLLLHKLSATTLMFLILLVNFARPVVPGFETKDGVLAGELFFGSVASNNTGTSYLLFAFWFLITIVIFFLISQRTAKLFRQFAPLKAYTLDILGSCSGIICFILLSLFQIPAYFWFVLIIPIFVITSEETTKTAKYILYASLMIVVFTVRFQDALFFAAPNASYKYHEAKWSPYQRVDVIDRVSLAVNGLHHQIMLPKKVLKNSFYTVPYKYHTSVKDVLIIGAGSGNDAATALFHGATTIDAVEIDPVLAEMGKKYHIERPYSDKRVNLIIDDGRSFLTNTNKKYDAIIFALPDSLIKTSPVAQLRLENYLFTKESINRAYNLLNNDGVLYLYNYYRKPWLIEKINNLIFSSTGKKAEILFKENDFVIFAAKYSPSKKINIEASFDAKYIIPTDDWPFLYLKNKGIPHLYIYFMAGITLLVVGLLTLMHFLSKSTNYKINNISSLFIKIAFVLMGSAFLLLETKSIVQFSLLFGTTWLNSSLVFLSVLALVLAANWTAQSINLKPFLPIIFTLLVVSCIITLIYPLSNLLYYDSKIIRFILAVFLTFMPIYFANLIFSVMFKNQKIAENLFGWNLIGATLGGVLEYFSMATGYNSLAIIVVICYILVFLLFWIAKNKTESIPSTV